MKKVLLLFAVFGWTLLTLAEASDGIGLLEFEFPEHGSSTSLESGGDGHPDAVKWFSSDRLTTIVVTRFPKDDQANLGAFVEHLQSSYDFEDKQPYDEGYREIDGHRFWNWKVRRRGGLGEIILRYAATFVGDQRYGIAVGSYGGDPDENEELISFWNSIQIEEGEQIGADNSGQLR